MTTKRVTEAEYGKKPVFCECGADSDMTGDSHYFSSIAVLRDKCREAGLVIPAEAIGCTLLPFALEDADYIIEAALQEHHEDAAEQVTKEATDALQAALDAWTEKYGPAVRTWVPDESVVVVLDKPTGPSQ